MPVRTATREPGFAIGTVAGLTGLDPHTIRAWERRYGAVSPQRGPRGVRRYDDAAVARLQLLKALTDCGESIGAVANLPDDALRERLGRLAGMAADGAPGVGRRASSIALLAPSLSAQLGAGASALGGFRVTAAEHDVGAFLEKLPDAAPEVVVVQLACLGLEPLRRLEEIQDACEPQLVVVLYDFARVAELARLSRSGARLVRGPLRVAQLRQLIEDFLAIETTSPQRRARPTPSPSAPDPPRRRGTLASNHRRRNPMQRALLPLLLLVLSFTCSSPWSATTDRERYATGDEGTTRLHNDSRSTLYLEGCSAFAFEKFEGGVWSFRFPALVCVWEGLAQPVAPGTDASFAFVAPDEAGLWRLRYVVGIGCDPALPLSDANCRRVFPLYTPPFRVQELCDPVACGPVLGMPNRLCPDGVNFAGPSGRCLLDAERGVCGWEVLDCP